MEGTALRFEAERNVGRLTRQSNIVRVMFLQSGPNKKIRVLQKFQGKEKSHGCRDSGSITDG